MPINVTKKTMQEIEVREVKTPAELQQAFEVRKKVFMEEQMISEADEFDAYDSGSVHLLAMVKGTPAGAARFRLTTDGVKLERFCTLSEFRGNGIAGKLIEQSLKMARILYSGHLFYLYAQVDVIPLYQKYGFIPEGPEFIECDIKHQKMILKP